MYGILILYVVLSITLICCQQFMRKFPYNFICLFLFTLCLSVLTGITTIQQKTSLILVAFGMALLITGGLIAFAFQTKYDFTTKNSLICVLLFSLIAFGICTSFWHSKMMHVLYCTMGFVLFSFILVFDVQLIIGGKHQYAFSEEDYIFAAFVLYLDIINLFLMILGMGRR
ncbi:hypothetical protein SNEBB_010989 [Seison nebaliae]|nr:hypothetical protein SNEBB_010989 [Seison nebaliae]